MNHLDYARRVLSLLKAFQVINDGQEQLAMAIPLCKHIAKCWRDGKSTMWCAKEWAHIIFDRNRRKCFQKRCYPFN